MAKFSSDNQPDGRGRPKGSQNKTTKLLKDATPKIIDSLVDSAINGDTQAGATLLRYSLPPVRPESRSIDLNMQKGLTLSEMAESLLDASVNGKCCPSTATQLVNALTNVAKIKEIDEILSRLEKLESFYEKRNTQ